MSIKRPLLAVQVTDEQIDSLTYPVIVSPKLDGIRTLIHPEHGPVTRKFKPVPNHHVREALDLQLLHGFDGELVVAGDFNAAQSAVMRHEGQPDVEFWVFDDFTSYDEPFRLRYRGLKERVGRVHKLDLGVAVHRVPQSVCYTPADVRSDVAVFIEEGYEGAMIRSPDGPYKQGRSTLRQEYLLKVKDFVDAEGMITGFEERMHNDNDLEKDEIGYAKRSTSQAGLVGTGTLGAFVLHTTQWGELRVGTGFTSKQRAEFWARRDELLGREATFKYQAAGMADKPRLPVFLRFRED